MRKFALALVLLAAGAGAALTETAAAEVEVRPLTGAALKGELQAITPDSIVLQTADGEKSIRTTDVLTISSQPAPLEVSPAAWVRLVDGSLLPAAQYTVADGEATITLHDERQVKVRPRDILSVRFKQQDERLAKQWAEVLAEEAEGDVIVIRKKSDPQKDDDGNVIAEGVESLDWLEGVFGDVTKDKVGFTFSGRLIEVDRWKVEGMVYFHPAGRETPEPICRVDAADGAAINARSVELKGDKLAIVSAAGVEFETPFNQVKKVDFSTGKIVFLSEIEGINSEWKPYLGSADVLESLQRLYRFKRDQALFGGPLQLDGQNYDKGLSVPSRTLLSFKLPGKYKRLLATVGIDDRAGDAGHVELVVIGDGQELKRVAISGRDEKPYPLDVNIEDVERLRILVDFGEDADIGDYLNLCNARITK